MIGPVKLSEIKSLTPLKASVIRLTELMADTNTPIEEFIKVIKFDQALTIKILSWANSSWSSSHSEITDIKSAVLRVGGATIVNMCIGNHLAKSMQRSCTGYELGENQLWRHSVAAALAVENMVNFSKQTIPAAAFTATLLHDIGKLILNRHIGNKDMNGRLKHMMNQDHMSYIEAEQTALNTNHALIGSAVANEWKLPNLFEAAIANHHDPDQQESLLLDAVHIGNAIAKLIGEGLGIEAMNLNVSSLSAERLGLTNQDIQALCVKTTIALEETESLWKLS